VEKNIEAKIEKSLQDTWGLQKDSLTDELKAVTGRIEGIIALEDHKRNGHKSNQLKKTFGSFGALTVNSEQLSTILESSEQSTNLDPERLQRIEKLTKTLEKARTKNDFSYLLFHFNDNSNEIIQKTEKHLDQQADVFKALRVARLEARAKYNPSLHDEFFEQFNWSHLDDDELALCSPVVVLLSMDQSFEQQFVDLLPLLSSGLPIKIFAIQNKITSRQLPDSSRAAVSSSSINIELLPLALQKVFVFQSVYGEQHFDDMLSKGIRSSHPGFFSVYYPEDTSNRVAVTSRAFPYFVYDPDSTSDFVTRLDISGNPQLESLWVKKELKFLTADGAESSMAIEETFADYLLSESEGRDEFSVLKSNGNGIDHIVPLSQYLAYSAEERLGKVPVVYQVKEDKTLEMFVPSRNVILKAAEKMNSWQALREITGIDNPLIEKSQQEIEEKLISEKDSAISNLQNEMESKSKERETQAVTTAIQNLSLKLFGMTGSGDVSSPITPVATPTPVAQQSAPAVSADVPVTVVEEENVEISEEAWIESSLCTTCDECTDINKKIFAYDENKLAYIKDPKGGPFKDIVKAAELCPPHIIHPGMPQDPNEKNLDKLIEQAEPYQ